MSFSQSRPQACLLICPGNKADGPLLGILWQGQYYVQKVLPFGLQSSPFLFSRLADALAYVAETNYGVRDLLYYLDDYFLVQPAAAPLTQRKFQALSSLFRQLGIPLAKGADKLCPTATIITFLGTEFNTVRQEIHLPRQELSDILGQQAGCIRGDLISGRSMAQWCLSEIRLPRGR